jgi:phosphoserine phosphatase RsbU/P
MSERRRRVARLAPLVLLALFAGADLIGGAQFIVLGLVVTSPLLAASLVGPRLTAAYGLAATAAAVILGFENNVYDGDYAGGLNAQLVRVFGVLLGSVAAVWVSARRLARERRLAAMTRVAEVAQRTILSPVPHRLGGLQLAVGYESAATDALVGGDLYEAVDTLWGVRLLVGDVRGKGLDAVRLASRVLGCFRSLAHRTDDPAALMRALDAEVAASAAGTEDFVTAVLVQIDPKGRTVVLNAGHPDPLLRTGAGLTEVTPPDRQPPLGLGTFPRPYRLQLDLGDRLLLYTDGLAEARRGTSRDFFPVVSAVSETLAHPSLTAGLAELVRRLRSWTDGGLADDVALLAIERRPADEPAPTATASNDVPHATTPLHT